MSPYGQRACVNEREASIHRSASAADLGDNGMSVAGIAHLEIIVKVLKDLGIEIVSARLRTLVEALVFCVLDHTNDFEIGGMRRIAFDAEAAANRRTIWKIESRHRLVNYGNLR